MAVLEELIELLALERIEDDLFRGLCQDLRTRAVFGGQVIAQALAAASHTVAGERPAHSLHAYFLRAGAAALPIVYRVERIREGASFTTRRVVALQAGQPIFELSASFQRSEPGFEHREPMPSAPPPESCLSEREHYARLGARAARMVERAELRPFELRMVNPPDDPFQPSPQTPPRLLWLRTIGKLPETPALHQLLLAYASDFRLLTTSVMQHGASWWTPGMQMASLDHALWFHHAARVDEWLLYVMDSPAAQGARGLTSGRIYTREGKLVASTAQEGLIRQREARHGG